MVKEKREFFIEVSVEDKTSGQADVLSKKEELEVDFSGKVGKPTEKEQIIQIDKSGKRYNLLLTIDEVWKGWFKDTAEGYSVKPMSDKFLVVKHRIIFTQKRPTGFIIVGIVILSLVGGLLAFLLWKKRQK